MTNGVQALPTTYCGVRFRSRTEARWAVFFDALTLRWIYEYEAVRLPNGETYTPDFYLPDVPVILEIKPPLPADVGWPDDSTMEKLRAVEDTMPNMRAVVLCGTPGYGDENDVDSWPYCGFICGDCHYMWTRCPVCGACGITYQWRSARVRHHAHCNAMTGDKGYNELDPVLRQAYEAAMNWHPRPALIRSEGR